MVHAKKDGFCFFTALHQCLERDHDIKISVDCIKDLLDYEIYQNNGEYIKSYGKGDVKHMLRALDDYLWKGKWAQDIGDIVVFAAAKCLKVNICIFQNVENRAMLFFIQTETPSNKDLFLKYEHEHYDSIVWKPQPIPNDPIDEATRKYFNEAGINFTHHLNTENTEAKVHERNQSSTKKQQQETATHGAQQRLSFGKPTVEDLGSDMESEDTVYFTHRKNIEANNTADQFPNQFATNTKRNSEQYSPNRKDSPFKAPQQVPDYEDLEFLEDVPPEFQFEESYEGYEDAVLDNLPISDSDDEVLALGDDTTKETTEQMSQQPSSNGDDVSSPIYLSDATSDSMSSKSSVFSDSSAPSTSRKKPRKYAKNKIDEQRMAKCPIEKVDAIPWDVNEDHVYEIPSTAETYLDASRDGRWFLMKAGSRKGLNGYRKVGSCQGSAICLNDKCSKLTAEGVINTSAFDRIGKLAFKCSSCGNMAWKIYCGCIKTIEFDRDCSKLRIQHQGTHICHLKPNVTERRKVLQKMPIPMTTSTTPKKYLQECFKVHLENDEVEEAFNVCDAISEADVIDQLKRMRKYPNRTVHRKELAESFSNVAHIQRTIKKAKRDRFLVYRWECEHLGGKSNYVFKTSEMSIKLALKMGGKIKIGMHDSSLREEPAFFDGMHKRVKDFVTLTLWVFHPALRKMQILAVMECPNEDSKNIELFFTIFNEAMADHLGEPGYRWDPFMIMTDEKGANFDAIGKVFGSNFVKAKVRTCQFHFTNCGMRYIGHLSPQQRFYFRRLCDKLCEAHTRQHYRKVSAKLKKFATDHKFLGWWKFWAPPQPTYCTCPSRFQLAPHEYGGNRAIHNAWLQEDVAVRSSI